MSQLPLHAPGPAYASSPPVLDLGAYHVLVTVMFWKNMSETVKNEVGCRDDTVPKTVGTRRLCEVDLCPCKNLPQPPPYISVFGAVEDCCMLSIVSCRAFLYQQFSAWCTSYFIFNKCKNH